MRIIDNLVWEWRLIEDVNERCMLKMNADDDCCKFDEESRISEDVAIDWRCIKMWREIADGAFRSADKFRETWRDIAEKILSRLRMKIEGDFQREIEGNFLEIPAIQRWVCFCDIFVNLRMMEIMEIMQELLRWWNRKRKDELEIFHGEFFLSLICPEFSGVNE